jgi:hypothetical protein
MREGRERCPLYRAQAGAPCARSAHRRGKTGGSEGLAALGGVAAGLQGGAVAWKLARGSQWNREEGCDGAGGLSDARHGTGRSGVGGSVGGSRAGSAGMSPRLGRAVHVQMTRLAPPGRSGGVGDVAVAGQTWSPAIGGCQAGKKRKGELRACTRVQRWRGFAGSRAGHQEAAKDGGGKEIPWILCWFPRW